MPGISRAYGHSLLADFLLDPAALHLNHGSYGAVPRRVMQAQNGFRELTERLQRGAVVAGFCAR